MSVAGAGGVWSLLSLLAAVCRSGSSHLSERGEGEASSGSGSGSGDSSEAPLTAEAIANIASSAAAVAVLGGAVCYLLLCFDRQERMQRVRAAQDRNRQITRQLEATKQAKREQKQQKKQGAERVEPGLEEQSSTNQLLFSQEHHSHHEDDDISGASRDPSQPLVTSPTTSKQPLT